MVDTGTSRIASLAVAAVAAAGCLAGDPRPSCDRDSAIATVCGFANPEDIEHVEAAGLLLSANMRHGSGAGDGGFIAGLVPGGDAPRRLWPGPADDAGPPEPTLGDPSCPGPPSPDEFSPHGLTSHEDGGRILVFVTAHAAGSRGREAVEVFELEGEEDSATLVWKACVPTAGGIQANDVAVAPDGEVVVTNYQPSGSLRHLLRSALLGGATGNLMTWRRGGTWRPIDGTDAALANGLAISRDGTLVFYTESLTGMLHRRPLGANGGAIAVEVEGNPDNLTWTPRDTLLLATHTSGAGLFWCKLGGRPCTTPWKLYEIDPATLAINEIFAHEGEIVGAVSSAAVVGSDLYLGSAFGDRIGLVASLR